MYKNILFEKGIFSLISSLLIYLYGSITSVVIIFAFFMASDYLTGLLVAFKTKKYTSKIAVWGIVKKVLYLNVILIAFLLDYALIEITQQLKITFGFSGLFGILTTAFLIGNEGISLYNNWKKLGLFIPIFFRKPLDFLQNLTDYVDPDITKNKKKK